MKLAAAAFQLAAEYKREAKNVEDSSDDDPNEHILVIGQITEALILSCGLAELKVLLAVIELFEEAHEKSRLGRWPGDA
jgi:hypothetical protein